MKALKLSRILLPVIFLLCISNCQEREMNNPFDANCPKEIFTPSNFNAEQQGNTIKLTWEQTNTNISGFIINRNENDGLMTEASKIGRSVTIWNDINVVESKKYGYQLVAYAGENLSNPQSVYLTPVFGSTVTTSAAASVTSNSAVLGGNVVNDGGAVVTGRGICYSTSQNPTTANNKVTMGSGTGAFSNNVSGLTAGTIYYAKAYAINSQGTAYGTQITFTTVSLSLATVTTTAAASITAISAVLGGNVTSDGNNTVTENGICYALTQNPTTANTIVTIGSGSGAFSKTVTGLTAGTTYYARAYAINSQGTAYGIQISFTTNQLLLATLSTTDATNVSATTAVLGGNVTNDGNAPVTERGVCYSLTQNPTTANTKLAIGIGTGTFSNTVSGLTANTTYYAKAYAINAQGTAYGTQITFTTVALALASLTTSTPINITSSSATLGGNVTSDGNATVTERGICYNTSQNPTTGNTKVIIGSGTGIFSNTIIGLLSNTIYYSRSYAINSQGTAYGNEVNFQTSVDLSLASLTTVNPTNITINSATSGGNVSSDGGKTVTAKGVCWSMSQNPTIANSKTTDGTGTGTFTSSITGLSPNTTYYLRAYATNSAGTAYGISITFTTLSIPGETVTDIDGNVYHTVAIGTQVWMVENLKTTKYRNGNPIPNVTDAALWSSCSTGAYCDYNNSPDNGTTYGKLYNWYAVNDSRNIAPTGWHVPTDAEWTTLTTYLGSVAGGKLKEAGTSHWASPNTGATNETGFTALPGGYRHYGGEFYKIGGDGYWWSSTSSGENPPYWAWSRHVTFSDDNLTRDNTERGKGFSVRCVRDL